MMLPLDIRNNRLLSIHIRSITLEYAKYSLMIQTEDEQNIMSNETEKTLVDYFILPSSLNLK
jgi:hypothetical protein